MFEKNNFYWKLLCHKNVEHVLLISCEPNGLQKELSDVYKGVSVVSNFSGINSKESLKRELDKVSIVDKEKINLVILDYSLHKINLDLRVTLEVILSRITNNSQLILLAKNNMHYGRIKQNIQNFFKNDGFSIVGCKRIMRQLNLELKEIFCFRNLITESLMPLPELTNLESKEESGLYVLRPILKVLESIKNSKWGMYLWPNFLLDIRYYHNNKFVFHENLQTIFQGKINKLISGNAGIDILIVEDDHNNEFVFRKYNNALGMNSCERNSLAINLLKNSLQNKIPQSFDFGIKDGVFIESKIEGKQLDTHKNTRQYFFNESNFWLSYQISKNIFLNCENDKILNFVKIKWSNLFDINQDLSLLIKSIVNNIEQILIGNDVFLTPIHGDFKSGNMLFNDNYELIGIIDWEHYQDQSLPLYDQLTMCVYMVVIENGCHTTTAMKHIFQGSVDETYLEFLENSLHLMGGDRNKLKIFVILYWLGVLSWKILDRNVVIDDWECNPFFKPLFLFDEYLRLEIE